MMHSLAIAAPLLKPFADGRTWVVMDDIAYTIGGTDQVITVPKGFVTDLASIPQVFWSIGLSPEGQYSRAAIVHDWLYWTQECSRQQSDNFLAMAMRESGVDATWLAAIYGAVRFCGWTAWNRNAWEREADMPRVIPEAYLEFGADVIWPQYRDYLQAQGIADGPFANDPPWCAIGDSIEVPRAELQT